MLMAFWDFFAGFFLVLPIVFLVVLLALAKLFNFLSPVLSAVLLGALLLLLVLLNLGFLAKGTLRLQAVFPFLERHPYKPWHVAFDFVRTSLLLLYPALVFFAVARYNAGTIGALGTWFAGHDAEIRKLIYLWVVGPGATGAHIPLNWPQNWYTLFGSELTLTVLFLVRWFVYWLAWLTTRALGGIRGAREAR